MERAVLPRGGALAATQGIADTHAERGRDCPQTESWIETCFAFPWFDRCRIPGDLQCCTTESKETEVWETSAYEGHSLSMLRRVAHALNTEVKVVLEPVHARKHAVVAESRVKYGSR